MTDNQRLGWRTDCLDRFNRGETVAILCGVKLPEGDKKRHWLYRVKARRRGIAKGSVNV